MHISNFARLLAGAACLAFGASSATAQPYGIDTPRLPNTGILINNLPPAAGTYTQQSVLGGFSSPVHVTNAGDGTNRVFVVEQNGLLRVFDADLLPTAPITTFFNATSLIITGSERGLLSVAFHPNYASNGKFYIFYTRAGDGDEVVAELINDNPAGNPIVVPTPRILLIQDDPFSNHNGGQLQFGADGYLYYGIGDGGSGDDPQDNGQRMTTMMGKICRIDVDTFPYDAGKQYHVPADNPLIYAGGSTTNVYVESRQPGGALTSVVQGYQEFGDFTDSAFKSTFGGSGLTGTGSRGSSNTPVSAIARFTPTIATAGLYNVYVTTTNNAAANAGSAIYRVVSEDTNATFTVALTPANTGNQWRRIRRNVPFAAGTGGYVEIQENGTQTGTFFADAVRFERVSGVLPEIYAFGLRNPWRFSPDRVTGRIWIGDVGQNNREEIDILQAGGNYGWRDVEGNICTPGVSPTCDLTGYVNPLHTFTHGGGACSVTGGYVYRGPSLPSLYGRYIYVDYCAGVIRGFLYDGTTVSDDRVIATTGLNITSFGEMEDGELLFVDGTAVRRLVQSGAPPVSDVPLALSDMPDLYTVSTGGNAQGIVPYAPREGFWTDGAIKTRHIAIPGVQQATYQADPGWDFPNGTTLVKNYRLPLIDGNPGSAVRVETRLLVKNAGNWTGFSYKWNAAQTDAFLLTSADTRDFTITTGGGPLSYTWQFPSSTQCLSCHTSVANRALGLTASQMNCDFDYPATGVTDNQLRTLDHISFFNPVLPGAPGTLPSMPASTNTGASLEDRAKAYMQANCAHCHRPGGPTPVAPDMRWGTSLASMGIVDAVPTAGDLGVPGARIVKSGLPDESVLLLRMESLDPLYRMPPLSSTREDEVGTQLIRDWIGSLTSSANEAWELY